MIHLHRLRARMAEATASACKATSAAAEAPPGRAGPQMAAGGPAAEAVSMAAAEPELLAQPSEMDSSGISWVQKWTRWRPTSEKELLRAEQKLFTLVKTPVRQFHVPVPPPLPLQSKLLSPSSWFRERNPTYQMRTATIDSSNPSAPTLVVTHGYGAALGFYFRNFDVLGKYFKVHAVDMLGWGASSRPEFTPRTTEETEAFFIDSLEEWRKAMKIDKMVLMGHSFGGYMSAQYALKYPENIQHLILVGCAGVGHAGETLENFKKTWKGSLSNFIWERNVTPQGFIRSIGPMGPRFVRGYTSVRFGSRAQGEPFTEEERQLFTEYMYHTIAARGSGELALKHIFQLGAYARQPLLDKVAELKVPTTFIYGMQDWMDYRAGELATKLMTVPSEVIRVPTAGHYVFMDNAPGFHAAVLTACRTFVDIDGKEKIAFAEASRKVTEEFEARQAEAAAKEQAARVAKARHNMEGGEELDAVYDKRPALAKFFRPYYGEVGTSKAEPAVA
ncbi:lysophosphatidic acid acyltransferase/triacylglycerol lipase/phosphatidylcholine hydrolase, CGI-53 homolog [Klebsormidium nitens]|uniref:Lysophosphatidic acid acyltransferase/triacylglycerol lipase/phosphatidylcholine hydrolase, CGI-53 homolog n=1 Tax=Klebsormidium nitens TaxID=105231 RepID=A0A1Y1IK66_KLENI|nr:lysophosphatidic acid acyltransferase/triacylglycerol lipase/phosphatidylcholine hydrolase, CGI-53 homolog [Klebsormidium nitens]|eukprot:GAQ91164.1 lysophosphatidic acid acyltransferase/triacylglycerol lipase/phosphatidylcholine hydrolase, CGI-53 homolog [Klebsormidium nitens]